MKTTIKLNIGTVGMSVHKIVKRIESIGFKSTLGDYDFAYEWDHTPTKSEVLSLGDKVVWALAESGSTFRMFTK